MSRARRFAAVVALAAAVPAAAYVLPVHGILRRLGERRAALALASLEVSGTIRASGEAGARIGALVGGPAGGAEAEARARFLMRSPGRCRLELAPQGAAEAERPHVSLRDGKLAGPLADVPAAVALVRAACTLLAAPIAANAGEAYAAALGRRGVALGEATLGRFDGRIAYVVGGRAKDPKPLLFVEKDGFQPLRLIAAEGPALLDVRLLGWGSPIGGDWFPRAVEVFAGDAPLLRFTAEKATSNPKLPDALF